jgi:hypothetical protein
LVVAESRVAEMHDGRGQRLITNIQAAQDRSMLERMIYLHHPPGADRIVLRRIER